MNLRTLVVLGSAFILLRDRLASSGVFLALLAPFRARLVPDGTGLALVLRRTGLALVLRRTEMVLGRTGMVPTWTSVVLARTMVR